MCVWNVDLVLFMARTRLHRNICGINLCHGLVYNISSITLILEVEFEILLNYTTGCSTVQWQKYLNK